MVLLLALALADLQPTQTLSLGKGYRVVAQRAPHPKRRDLVLVRLVDRKGRTSWQESFVFTNAFQLEPFANDRLMLHTVATPCVSFLPRRNGDQLDVEWEAETIHGITLDRRPSRLPRIMVSNPNGHGVPGAWERYALIDGQVQMRGLSMRRNGKFSTYSGEY